MKRNYTVLIIWVLLLLFPLNWLIINSKSFDAFISPLFNKEWVHILMHIIIYAGLTILLFYNFRVPQTFIQWGTRLIAIFGIAILQEYLQLLSKDRSFGGAEIFDFLVDLAGIVIGFLYFYRNKLWTRIKKI